MRDKITAYGALVFLVCFGIGVASFAVGCGAAMGGHSTTGAVGVIIALVAGLVGLYAFIVFQLAKRD